MKRLIQTRAIMNRQTPSIDLGRNPRLLTNMREIGRQAVAQIESRRGHAAQTEPLPDARLGVKVRSQFGGQPFWNARRSVFRPRQFFKPGQSSGSSTQRSRHVQQITGPSARAQQSAIAENRSDQNNVRHGDRRLSQVAAGQRNAVHRSQSQQSVEKT